MKVVARDAQGHQATMVFKIRVGKAASHASASPVGRAGLSQQLRMAATRAHADVAARTAVDGRAGRGRCPNSPRSAQAVSRGIS